MTGDAHVAYTVSGQGPPDIVFASNWDLPLEARWQEPRIAGPLRRLASFSRLIGFDKRGVGCSDPTEFRDSTTLEEWSEDIRVVMDAAESERAVVLASGEGGSAALLFAVTHPTRVAALVLSSTTARWTRAPDYPFGIPPSIETWVLEGITQDWATGASWRLVAPTLADDRELRRWWSHQRRLQASPATGKALSRMVMSLDLRDLLPLVQCPTLVLHRRDEAWMRVDHGRYLAEHIPGARLVELEGSDGPLWAGDAESVIDEIEEFTTGVRRGPEPDRVLAAVLVTDIVASTERVEAMGDRRWRDLLDTHDLLVRHELERFRGRLIKTTGDGVLATFDGPARAIRCASALIRAAATLGVDLRAGIHAGEVELRGDDVAGIAVHVATRVAAEASGAAVAVSSSVPPLVAGSAIRFESLGPRPLKGVSGEWELFRVVDDAER